MKGKKIIIRYWSTKLKVSTWISEIKSRRRNQLTKRGKVGETGKHDKYTTQDKMAVTSFHISVITINVSRLNCFMERQQIRRREKSPKSNYMLFLRQNAKTKWWKSWKWRGGKRYIEYMLTKKEESLMILMSKRNGIQGKQTFKEIKKKFS